MKTMLYRKALALLAGSLTFIGLAVAAGMKEKGGEGKKAPQKKQEDGLKETRRKPE